MNCSAPAPAHHPSRRCRAALRRHMPAHPLRRPPPQSRRRWPGRCPPRVRGERSTQARLRRPPQPPGGPCRPHRATPLRHPPSASRGPSGRRAPGCCVRGAPVWPARRLPTLSMEQRGGCRPSSGAQSEQLSKSRTDRRVLPTKLIHVYGVNMAARKYRSSRHALGNNSRRIGPRYGAI